MLQASRMSAWGVFLVMVVVGVSGSGRESGRFSGTDRDCSAAGCHDGFARAARQHRPVADAMCGACHRETDPDLHRFELRASPPRLCESCHDIVGPAVSAAVPAGLALDCLLCHDPHASNRPALLSEDTQLLCAQCHDEAESWFEPDRVPHGDVEVSRDCAICHDPHGVPHGLNLKAPMPSLCLDCHEEIREMEEAADLEHKAGTLGHLCANCHDPHTAKLEYLLRDEPKVLCLQCHDKEISTDGRTVANLAEILAERPRQHGSIRAGNCAGCHSEVHGGSHRRRLRKTFSDAFYVKYDATQFGLCFMCHEEHLTSDATTTAFTDFRNGDRNLHFVHVHREKKGRNCTACHDVHASKQAALVADSIPFGPGGWRIPIRFKKTATGGSCETGCHRPQRYDRVKPVPLPELPPTRDPGHATSRETQAP